MSRPVQVESVSTDIVVGCVLYRGCRCRRSRDRSGTLRRAISSLESDVPHIDIRQYAGPRER